MMTEQTLDEFLQDKIDDAQKLVLAQGVILPDGILFTCFCDPMRRMRFVDAASGSLVRAGWRDRGHSKVPTYQQGDLQKLWELKR